MTVLIDAMSQEKRSSPTQAVHLVPGAQAVINGALVSARERCTLEVSAGAYVLTGRALWPATSDLRNPCDELYFSILDCVADEERFYAERFRLFALLGEVAAHGGPAEKQRDCSKCAAAVMAGDAKAALECAARLAASRMETHALRAAPAEGFVERRKAPPRGV